MVLQPIRTLIGALGSPLRWSIRWNQIPEEAQKLTTLCRSMDRSIVWNLLDVHQKLRGKA